MTDHSPSLPFLPDEHADAYGVGKVVHLYRLREEEVPELLERLAGNLHQAGEWLSRLTYNDRTRLLAGIEQTGEAWPERVLPLLELLYAPDLLVHDHLAAALRVHGYRDPQATIRLCERMAREGYPKAREFAAEVLVALALHVPDEVRMTLTEWAGSDAAELRETVARYYRIGGEPISRGEYQLLDQLSRDEYSAVRQPVAEAMGHYLVRQVPEAFPIVERLARDNRWETAAAAIDSVGKCGPHSARQALRLLRTLVQHELRSIRRRAARSLRQLAVAYPRRTLAFYKGMVRDRDYMDIDVLQTLLLSLRDLWHRDREQARELLVQLAQDQDEELSGSARALLAEFGEGE